MKQGILIALILIVLGNFNSNAQSCDSLYRIVERYFHKSEEGKIFITDGQVYTTFLDNEKAEFTTTLYGNNLYRIGASAGVKENFAIFTLLDMENNILFTNKDHNNSPYWDFRIENTIPVKIQTELDTNKKNTGCFVMMIGFQK